VFETDSILFSSRKLCFVINFSTEQNLRKSKNKNPATKTGFFFTFDLIYIRKLRRTTKSPPADTKIIIMTLGSGIAMMLAEEGGPPADAKEI
jgi:hypothetical protein